MEEAVTQSSPSVSIRGPLPEIAPGLVPADETIIYGRWDAVVRHLKDGSTRPESHVTTMLAFARLPLSPLLQDELHIFSVGKDYCTFGPATLTSMFQKLACED